MVEPGGRGERSLDRRCLVFYDGVLSYAEVERKCEPDRPVSPARMRCEARRPGGACTTKQPSVRDRFLRDLPADVVVPVNPMNRTLEIEHMLGDSECQVLFTAQDIAAESRPLLLKERSVTSSSGRIPTI